MCNKRQNLKRKEQHIIYRRLQEEIIFELGLKEVSLGKGFISMERDLQAMAEVANKIIVHCHCTI